MVDLFSAERATLLPDDSDGSSTGKTNYLQLMMTVISVKRIFFFQLLCLTNVRTLETLSMIFVSSKIKLMVLKFSGGSKKFRGS